MDSSKCCLIALKSIWIESSWNKTEVIGFSLEMQIYKISEMRCLSRNNIQNIEDIWMKSSLFYFKYRWLCSSKTLLYSIAPKNLPRRQLYFSSPYISSKLLFQESGLKKEYGNTNKNIQDQNRERILSTDK